MTLDWGRRAVVLRPVAQVPVRPVVVDEWRLPESSIVIPRQPA